MVAFNNLMAVFMSHNDSKRANHDTGPASHTFIRIIHNLPCLRMSVNAARDAGLSAKRFFTMAALHRDRANVVGRSPFVNAFHVDAVFGQGKFLDGIGQFF